MKKLFKKILLCLIIVSLAVSAFGFNVSAASASISGTGEYEVGKSFNVTVRFNADATLYVVDAKISYNKSVLRLNKVTGADYTENNGTIKIYDEAFTPEKPSKTSSYTLNFTAIAAGNSNISVSVVGGGEGDSYASGSAAVTVVTPKPSSNANLASIKLSSGALSPAFNPNTTNYTATVKYSVDSITITGAVADGGATYTGGGTFALNVGDNSRVLTVTAQDGTKKSYTVNIKRMTEQETADAEQAARDANPLLVVLNDADYTIVNSFEGIIIPAGFTQGTATRKETEIAVLNSADGKYQLCWLVDAAGENGAFYRRDENDNFTKLAYINSNDVMYIIESIDDEAQMPSGFVRASYEIDGSKVDAIQHLNEAYKDFYIFNCYVSGQSENAFYRYDTVEGTMQRAAEYNFAANQTDSDIIDDEPQDTDKVIGFNTMNKTGKTVFIMIVVVALMLILITVLIVVKIVSSRNDDFDDDESYASDTGNGFIMGDSGTQDINDNSNE
ncbi:MAG: hypothetical protein E7521_07150 [Ruminococcaceae bacterium]|nr:hypothetical protein [Oscillospiraceae bacterium]